MDYLIPMSGEYPLAETEDREHAIITRGGHYAVLAMFAFSVILLGHTAKVTCAAMSSPRRIAVTGGLDCTVRVWSLDYDQYGACIAVFTTDSPITDVALSADGHSITAVSDKGGVFEWEIANVP